MSYNLFGFLFFSFFVQVVCGSVALECALLYCRDKAIPNARDECRDNGVLAAVLSVLEKQLNSFDGSSSLSYLVCCRLYLQFLHQYYCFKNSNEYLVAFHSQ